MQCLLRQLIKYIYPQSSFGCYDKLLGHAIVFIDEMKTLCFYEQYLANICFVMLTISSFAIMYYNDLEVVGLEPKNLLSIATLVRPDSTYTLF